VLVFFSLEIGSAGKTTAKTNSGSYPKEEDKMAKSIVGVYETPEETMNAIEGLTSRGYDTDDIAVITNRRDADYLEERTGAEVANAEERDNDHNQSFWDKLKDYFTMNDEYDRSNQLSNINIPEDELDSYTTELDDGKFILTVDEAAAAVNTEDSTLGGSTLGAVGSRTNSNFNSIRGGTGETTLGDIVGVGIDEDTSDPLGRSRTDKGLTEAQRNGDSALDTSGRPMENGIETDTEFRTPNRGGIDNKNDINIGKSTFGAGKMNDEGTGFRNNEDTVTNGTTDFDNSRTYGQNRSDSLNDTGLKEEKAMELREEVLDVNKKEVKTGDVQVGKDVETEEKSFDVPVKHEEVYVERRPVSEHGEDVSAESVDGSETLRVPIVEEKLEVQKKPVVTEEVVVGKRTVEEQEHVSETVKKEKARIDSDGKRVVNRDQTLND
jgi:uncharacterized protein (TIGR02271 family)